MHIIFVPYGKKSEVDLLISEMSAQKHQLLMWKGREQKSLWIQGQVRILPFGIYEYVCPREDTDKVLTTLKFHENLRYTHNLLGLKLAFIRKTFKASKPNNIDTSQNYLWITENVNIIPIGIKDDLNIVGTLEHDKGWIHEAI